VTTCYQLLPSASRQRQAASEDVATCYLLLPFVTTSDTFGPSLQRDVSSKRLLLPFVTTCYPLLPVVANEQLFRAQTDLVASQHLAECARAIRESISASRRGWPTGSAGFQKLRTPSRLPPLRAGASAQSQPNSPHFFPCHSDQQIPHGAGQPPRTWLGLKPDEYC
jgi:hypothetical protein